jgi:hypothetical protein
MALQADRSDVMTRLRRLTIAALAAATVTVGGLATVPTATALPMSCSTALALANFYINTGNGFLVLGNYAVARYWFGKAEGVMDAAC